MHIHPLKRKQLFLLPGIWLLQHGSVLSCLFKTCSIWPAVTAPSCKKKCEFWYLCACQQTQKEEFTYDSCVIIFNMRRKHRFVYLPILHRHPRKFPLREVERAIFKITKASKHAKGARKGIWTVLNWEHVTLPRFIWYPIILVISVFSKLVPASPAGPLSKKIQHTFSGSESSVLL